MGYKKWRISTRLCILIFNAIHPPRRHVILSAGFFGMQLSADNYGLRVKLNVKGKEVFINPENSK